MTSSRAVPPSRAFWPWGFRSWAPFRSIRRFAPAATKAARSCSPHRRARTRARSRRSRARWRNAFPSKLCGGRRRAMSEREVYADHAATTPPAPEVLEAMAACLGDAFGNASSVHHRGEAARDRIEAARERVAELIGATSEEIVFVASGSEANNLALKGLLLGAPGERRRLVVSAVEHPSVLETARWLEARGVHLTVVPVGADGIVDLDALRETLGSDV